MSTFGKVTGIVANLVTVQVDGPVAENELCYIKLGGTDLLAEVIKVNGDKASVQVFESTRGLRNGDSVEFLGRMLEVTLGPGLLSSIYDGLENDLTTMEGAQGRPVSRKSMSRRQPRMGTTLSLHFKGSRSPFWPRLRPSSLMRPASSPTVRPYTKGMRY